MRIASALIVGALASLSFAAGGFSFTFDSDNEGWTQGDFGNGYANIDVDAAGPAVWNPGGWIDGSDFAGYAFNFSPDLGGNHGDLFGQDITFDFRFAGTSAYYPFVVLMSSTEFLVLEDTAIPSQTMLPYSYKLDSSTPWAINSSNYYGIPQTATDAEIQAVLNDLRYVGISADLTGGGDETDIDNVMAVPEPASMLALGAGLAALAARRRRK